MLPVVAYRTCRAQVGAALLRRSVATPRLTGTERQRLTLQAAR